MAWQRIGPVLASLLLALPVAAPRASASVTDACALLSDAEVRDVQGQAVADRIASAHESASLRVLQCVYRSSDFTSSVSLALTVPRTGRSGGPLDYWNSRFHPEGGHQGKEEPPRPIADLGEEAYWVGDAAVGALYVLVGERFLRISVGGARDAAVRERRAVSLADQALSRLSERRE